MNSKSSGRGLEGFLAGRGFYIVLFLCAAAIGLSAWMAAAGSEAAENVRPGGDVSLEKRRVETIIITPAPAMAPDRVETMAVPDVAEETVAGAAEEEQETMEEVWQEDLPAEEPVTLWPVQGEIERLHDVESLHYDVTLRDWRTHEGVDILAPLGETVCAAHSGVVSDVREDALYGTSVTVDHGDGTSALYANLASLPAVETGDWVNAGDAIGAVGTTALCEIGQGTHLHFAMYLDGQGVDPLDYLPA